MRDFERELKDMISKYYIVDASPRFKQYLDMFEEIWRNIPDSDPIAFYGDGDGFWNMSKRVDLNSKNVVCIVSNTPGTYSREYNIPVVSVEELGGYTFRRIILTGFKARKKMADDIRRYDENIEIIDIYEILSGRGVNYNRAFFEIYLDEGVGALEQYYVIERLREGYAESADGEARDYLMRLIGISFHLRDFLCARLYIDEYIGRKLNGWDKMAELKRDLEDFLASLASALQARTSRNVFVFVLDATSFSMSRRVPFFNELAEKSLVFTNVHSPGKFTRATYWGMLTGRHYVSDGLYQYLDLDPEQSELLKEMHERGVKFKHISTPYFSFLKQVNDYETIIPYPVALSEMNWRMMMEVLNDPADCVYIVHGASETHSPYLSLTPSERLTRREEILHNVLHPEKAASGYAQRVKRLKEDGLQASGKQLKFCIDLLGIDKDPVIITSDHLEQILFAKELGITDISEMERIFLIIHAKSAKPGVYSDIFSTIDMPNILRQLINGEQTLRLTGLDCARQEQEPSYGRALSGFNKNNPFFGGFITLITLKDQYTFFLNGYETYYRLPNKVTNLIGDAQYRERIDYFRNQIDVDTQKVWEFMFQKYPELLELYGETADELLKENRNPKRLIAATHN